MQQWTLTETIEKLQQKKISSVELVKKALAAAQKQEYLNAIITLTSEQALAQAKEADKNRATGSCSFLGGIPVALKDIFLTTDVRTTCASKILNNFIATYDSTAVKKLSEAGGISIGKLNMDEFAMGSSNENSSFGLVKNPWSFDRSPGGSSGGSAAAVAAGIVFGSLGTDTGGSIRQPASFSGVVGIKPTYGRVSRFGVVAFASSLDQVGVLARTVSDAAVLLQAISGHDVHDATSSPMPVPNYSRSIESGVKALRIGVPKEYFSTGLQPEVAQAIEAAIQLYQKLGATIVEISLPHTDYAISAYYVICTAEASANLARYDGARYGLSLGREQGLASMYEKTRDAGFGAEVKRRIILGTYVLAAGYYDAYYKKASQVRTLLAQDFAQAFQQCDVILGPTTPTTAFKLGEKLTDPLQMYLGDVFTVSCNLAGLPGLSLPCGFDRQNLPIGMQLLGKHFDEPTLFRVARAYERETRWHHTHPPLFSGI